MPVTRKQLAKMTGHPVRTLRRYLAELEATGRVKIYDVPGRGGAIGYDPDEVNAALQELTASRPVLSSARRWRAAHKGKWTPPAYPQ